MITAMFLAHLFGDYVLQWDALARAKGQSLRGVLAHGLVVLVVTWLFSVPFDPGFWPWVLFICGIHTAVDALPLWLIRALKLKRDGLFELSRLLIDQAIHGAVIVLALVVSGYLRLDSLGADILRELYAERELTMVLGYTFIAMPAWILVEFSVYGLLNGSAPDFGRIGQYKYVGTLERWLIVTFVLLGQFMLVPLVTIPRVVMEAPAAMHSPRPMLYVAELLASVTLAVAIGLALRQL